MITLVETRDAYTTAINIGDKVKEELMQKEFLIGGRDHKVSFVSFSNNTITLRTEHPYNIVYTTFEEFEEKYACTEIKP